ncbi:envelope glycoprotein M [Vespertilionid gammaherpesvirus 1]|uniref:Envelope glycoprotein M n=1 Tax=Vespertilionid gammaherpesvirus 1 TaxID=2560830 RepID=A0A0X9X663_9GAMA|nr:envelope glycoprotein M [Myotis gammaherpesvirus 8]AMA67395.1 envelope glycoprotein M [Vespertilionid gammaherpesvirus 1]
MKSSKSDKYMYATWVKLLILYFVMFGMSVVIPIAAYFPDLGFPCYFNALVNYSDFNLTQRNVAKHITPTLFLEAPEMFAYITVSFIVDCCAACYYFFGAFAILRAKKLHITTLTSLSQWIALVGSPTLIIIGLWRLWTIQLFIQTLSYKHIYLAAFVYTIHFMLSFIHIQFHISRNSQLWAIKALEQSVPAGTMLETVIFKIKPIIANMHLFCLALEMLVFSLSFMMAIGNSFFILVSDVVFGSINVHIFLIILWILITELYLAKYIQIQLGFHIGIIMSSVILVLPLFRYEQMFVAANLHRAVTTNIAMILVIGLVSSIIRILRLYWTSRKSKVMYFPLSQHSGPRRAKKSKRNHRDGNIIMEESETEEL